MNLVVEYLKKAFEGRKLSEDAQKLEIPVEKLVALLEGDLHITLDFAKSLEDKISSIVAKDLLAAQVEQSKAEAVAAGAVDVAAQAARVEKPAAAVQAPVRQGRTGQSSSQPSFQKTQAIRSRTIY
jgi:plasmid maintenance system antidote protein VapI